MKKCAQCGRRLNAAKPNQSRPDPDYCVRCFRRIDEISLSRGLRTLLSASPETQRTSQYQEREAFYFMQVFHPDRGERANREFARTMKS